MRKILLILWLFIAANILDLLRRKHLIWRRLGQLKRVRRGGATLGSVAGYVVPGKTDE